MSYTVGQVARLAGITVRTLHHYDEVGLLSPSERSTSGYRRYLDSDLATLAEILRYRELGYSLADIRGALTADQDALTALRHQRGQLLARMTRLQRMVAVIDRQIEARRAGLPLDPAEILDGSHNGVHDGTTGTVGAP